MKNLKKLFVAFIAMVTAVSCGDPELPVELFPEMQYGAYARKMSQTGKFNYYDVANSTVDMHVEYYDEARGANITEFDIDVEYVDNITGGLKSKPRTNYMTITSSEFTTNADGYLSSDISLSFSGTLSALGITESDIDGGAYFRYWFTITKSDGTTYTYDNTGPNLMASNAFGALFRLNVSIVCPSALEGSLTVDHVSVPNAGVQWTDFTLTDVSLTMSKSGAENIYVIEEDAAWGGWLQVYSSPSVGPKVQDACGVMSMFGADQYGDTYSLVAGTVSVSADNKVLTFEWTNTWGEGGVVDAKYADGSSWPSGLTN